MVSSDPISDMLSRIRNAIMVNKHVVRMPFSKLKHTIATILKEAGYIDGVEIDAEEKFQQLVITINQPGTNPRIIEIERVSKPGRRLYKKAHEIPKVMNGRGILIVSTSKGIMTDAEARQEKVGGELMCKVF